MTPLVSICTPTTPDRRHFLRQCQDYVKSQTYPNLEWVIADAFGQRGEFEPFSITKADMCPIRWVVAGERRPVGHMRNVANRAARGSVIVHFDDDDYYGPESVWRRVEPILASSYVHVTDVRDYHVLHLTDPPRAAPVPKASPNRCGSGNSLAYRRSTWEASPFRNHPAEDRTFVRDKLNVMRSLQDDSILIYVRHGKNTCLFPEGDGTDTLSRVKEIVGEHWRFYEALLVNENAKDSREPIA